MVTFFMPGACCDMLNLSIHVLQELDMCQIFTDNHEHVKIRKLCLKLHSLLNFDTGI